MGHLNFEVSFKTLSAGGLVDDTVYDQQYKGDPTAYARIKSMDQVWGNESIPVRSSSAWQGGVGECTCGVRVLYQ